MLGVALDAGGDRKTKATRVCWVTFVNSSTNAPVLKPQALSSKKVNIRLIDHAGFLHPLA
jgi:hypothetical protein